MSLHILVSHTGQRLQADPNQIVSPDALRQWISERTTIPVARQILMTSRGKSVRQQHIQGENEVFVYDRQYVTGEAEPPSSANRPKPSLRRLREPPSTITDETNLQSWQELFMARRTWAAEATDIVKSGAEAAQECSDEIDVIARCSQVALDNLKTHAQTLQQKFDSTRKWAEEALEEHRSALNDWKVNHEVLAELPARSDIVGLLHRPSTPTANDVNRSKAGNLQELFDLQCLGINEDNLRESSAAFAEQVHALDGEVADFAKDAAEALKDGESSWDGTETANGLLEESQTLASRIDSDYDEILRLPNTQKSVASASRRALVHTRDLLPALSGLIQEANQLQTASVMHRNEVSETSFRALRTVSRLESRLGGLQAAVGKLDLNAQGAEALEILNKVFQLPVVYGSTLVEAVRRANWTQYINSEMGNVQEELEGLKIDEVRRRKKWASSVGDFLDDAEQESALVGFDVSPFQPNWPDATKQEVQDYIEHLKRLGVNDAVAEVIILMRNLEVKPRKKNFKAFKNGSIHELSSSSMLQANGEEFKSLQDEKGRLEDKLKASDSRIRKLEDLLHRQSQSARLPSSTFGATADFDRRALTPSPVAAHRPTELLSRKLSTASRRLSNANLDEKALVQRIVGLESEINRLKQEAHDDRRSSTESKDKMEEAESVKRDLMANFESQKQEFDDERQLLEDEAHKLKIRIEEVEDELDRLAGSRDHFRVTSEQTISGLQAELERLKRNLEEQSTKSRNKYEIVESSLNTQRDRVAILEKQLQQYKDEKPGLQAQNLSLANRLREGEQQLQDHIAALQDVHSNLSPQGSAPEDFTRLVRALEILSEGSAIHTRGQEDALQLATAEVKSLEERLVHSESQVKRFDLRSKSEESARSSLREELARERGQVGSLQNELAKERKELESFRDKFAAGETGSEALRERLSEEEEKSAALNAKIADAEANAQSAAREVEDLRSKIDALTKEAEALSSHLDARGIRAKDLSQRLFQYNDRIVRMLEQIGYSVTTQDDKLVIQRASKVNASTTLVQSAMGEVSAAMKRTISGSSPTQHFSDPSDLETLYWMSDTDAKTEENRFQKFVATLSRLDMDSTVETITKRYKDVEALAKKYQKESRAYREKSHRLQSEAHEKIAYRSFKEGDLALFLPTRNQATRPWAAFNVGAPHYFLREQDAHKLQSRDWLLARINKIDEKVVDLSRSMGSNKAQPDRFSLHADAASDGASMRSTEDDNPFELSDGLRWYLLEAAEEKPGAPSTPGQGKSTVAASNVEVKGSIGKKVEKSGAAANAANMVTKTLNKSLDSRRSSSGSKKGIGHTPTPSISNAPTPILAVTNEDYYAEEGSLRPAVRLSDADVVRVDQPAREDNEVFNVVRKDLLFGP